MPTGVGCSESAAVWAYQREWDVPLQSSLLLFLSVFDTTTFSLPKLQSDDCKNRGRAPAVDVVDVVVVVVEEVTITMSQCRAEAEQMEAALVTFNKYLYFNQFQFRLGPTITRDPSKTPANNNDRSDSSNHHHKYSYTRHGNMSWRGI